MTGLKAVPSLNDTSDIVATARQLIDGLESGEFVAFAAVAIRNGKGPTLFVNGPTVPLLATIGAVSVLHSDLLSRVTEEH